MAETFKCPKCGKSLALLKRQAGKKGRCQACGTVFIVPASASQAARSSAAVSNPSPSPAPSAETSPAETPPAETPPAERAPAEAAEPERRGVSWREMGLGAFVASHRLTLAVVAVALVASVTISVAGQPLVGVLLALAGFGIAPFGLLAIPAPHQSSSGKIFAAVAGMLFLNLIVMAAVFGYFRAPAGDSTAIRAVFYLGLIALLGIVVALIALGSWLMSRFGFFRPAAWAYVALAPCALIAGLFLSGARPAPTPAMQVAVAPPAPVKVAPPAPAPVPTPPVVALPPTPSIDASQLQKMLEQVQIVAEMSQVAQKLASDPQGGLDDLDRLAKKQQGAADASQAAPGMTAPGAGQAAPGSIGLEQKLTGMVAGLNELADALAAIRDESGSRGALGKVREIIGRIVRLVNAPTALDSQGLGGLKADVVTGHNARHQAAVQRVAAEVTRIGPISGSQEVVAEVNRFLAQLRAVSPSR